MANKHKDVKAANVSLEPFELYLPVQEILKNPEEFVYTLVHEIRNPLTSINLAINVLKQMANDDLQEKYLDIITRNSTRIKNMVDDLLNSQNANKTEWANYSIATLLDEVLLMNEDRFMFKNIAVWKNFGTRDFQIELNSSKVKIALTNIIVNAVEAMPASSGRLEITFKVLHEICFIVIQDNGTGISKEDLENIFKPYFTNKPDGMGLGLPATLSILNSNNIGLNVRSEPGKGTRFILSYKKQLV